MASRGLWVPPGMRPMAWAKVASRTIHNTLQDKWVLRWASDVILADFTDLEDYLKAYAAKHPPQ